MLHMQHRKNIHKPTVILPDHGPLGIHSGPEVAFEDMMAQSVKLAHPT
jgi:hypothetical protein